jgi:hypothetical protein
MDDGKYFKIKAGLYASVGLLFVFAATSACAADEANRLGQPSGVAQYFPQPERIHYDGHCFTIDVHDVFIRSAEFHYFRTPHALWRDRFQKIQDAVTAARMLNSTRSTVYN